MAVLERHTTRLSFFGRVADDLDRRALTAADISVQLAEGGVAALQKPDGFFAFANTEVSAQPYHVQIRGGSYEPRSLARVLSAPAPLELNADGEDEFYVVAATVTAAQKRVGFAAAPYLPAIDAGASVIGEGGFVAKLAEAIGGPGVNAAVLDSVAGLAQDELLRIVRSRNLLLRAGPYYPFPAGLTILALRIAESGGDETAVAAANVSVATVNGVAATAVPVGALTLRRFDIAGGATLLLDDLHASTVSNVRGDAVLYFPGELALTQVGLVIAHPRYQTANVNAAVSAGARASAKALLTRI